MTEHLDMPDEYGMVGGSDTELLVRQLRDALGKSASIPLVVTKIQWRLESAHQKLVEVFPKVEQEVEETACAGLTLRQAVDRYDTGTDTAVATDANANFDDEHRDDDTEGVTEQESGTVTYRKQCQRDQNKQKRANTAEIT